MGTGSLTLLEEVMGSVSGRIFAKKGFSCGRIARLRVQSQILGGCLVRRGPSLLSFPFPL